MEGMFQRAQNFNSNLSQWNVSAATKLSDMFYGAISFNSDLSKWDVSAVTSMSGLFSSAASFTSDLSRWNVMSVTDMTDMFYGAYSFTSDLSGWNVANVESMASAFYSASSFQSDLSKWNVSALLNMDSIFEQASSFSSDLCAWGPQLSANVTVLSAFYQSNCNVNDIGTTYNLYYEKNMPLCHVCHSNKADANVLVPSLIGGVLFAILSGLIFWSCWKNKRNSSKSKREGSAETPIAAVATTIPGPLPANSLAPFFLTSAAPLADASPLPDEEQQLEMMHRNRSIARPIELATVSDETDIIFCQWPAFSKRFSTLSLVC